LFLLEPFIQEHHISIGRDAFNLLSERCLLVRKRRRNKPITTFSDHWMRKYPNLIEGFYPAAPNQLWVSDISYIVVWEGFAYLGLITDAYSRKIVGFYLSVDLSAEGCIRALNMALGSNKDDLGRLIHHSDRGSQYCCSDYVGILNDNSIRISMTQNGDPRENAIAERVNGILKDELLEKPYANYGQAVKGISVAISIYNHQRPHGSIDYLMPIEAHFKSGELERKWKTIIPKRTKKPLRKFFSGFKPLFAPFRYALLHREGFKNCKLYLGLKPKCKFETGL